MNLTPSTSRRPKAHERVANILRDRIVTGELAAGDRLPPEDELTTQFGIARTTLREALRVLESQGLLLIRRGRGGGPVVTHPSLEPAALALAISLQLQRATVGDLDETRRLIEPQIAGNLALKHDDADIAALNHAIDAASSAAEAGDRVAFADAAARVHETLIERSGNTTMAMLSKVLHEVVNDFYHRSSSRSDERLMKRAVSSYRRLVDFIVAGDREAAIAHWQSLMTYTISGQDAESPITLAEHRSVTATRSRG